jgi:hypothetical protein
MLRGVFLYPVASFTGAPVSAFGLDPGTGTLLSYFPHHIGHNSHSVLSKKTSSGSSALNNRYTKMLFSLDISALSE